jgi:hypothetical protein
MNADENLIDDSLIKKVNLAQLGFFESVICCSGYSLVELGLDH